jgi:hypothetical protein
MEIVNHGIVERDGGNVVHDGGNVERDGGIVACKTRVYSHLDGSK